MPDTLFTLESIHIRRNKDTWVNKEEKKACQEARVSLHKYHLLLPVLSVLQ